MHHNIGFLKQLITDNVIWINRKGRDERCEANHYEYSVFLQRDATHESRAG